MRPSAVGVVVTGRRVGSFGSGGVSELVELLELEFVEDPVLVVVLVVGLDVLTVVLPLDVVFGLALFVVEEPVGFELPVVVVVVVVVLRGAEGELISGDAEAVVFELLLLDEELFCDEELDELLEVELEVLELVLLELDAVVDEEGWTGSFSQLKRSEFGRLWRPLGPFTQVVPPSVNAVKLSIFRHTIRPPVVRCSELPLAGLKCSSSRQLPTLVAPTRSRRVANP